MKIMRRMTKLQKFIASCINPYYGGLANKKEVKLAKRLAKGKYWDESDFGNYCAFSPSGERCFFDYDGRIKHIAKQSAKLWAQGKCDEAKEFYNSLYERIKNII